MIIAVGNLKGGVGTSTLAIEIAAAHRRAGRSVVLVDTTLSLTTERWCKRREALGLEPRSPVVAERTLIESTLDCLAYYDTAVVDVASHQAELEVIQTFADVWIAPCMASRMDLDATLQLYANLRQTDSRCSEGHAIFGVVLTQTPATGSLRQERARKYLRERAPGMLIFKQDLPTRRAWREGDDGRSLFDLLRHHAGKALDEFTAILAEIDAATRDVIVARRSVV